MVHAAPVADSWLSARVRPQLRGYPLVFLGMSSCHPSAIDLEVIKPPKNDVVRLPF